MGSCFGLLHGTPTHQTRMIVNFGSEIGKQIHYIRHPQDFLRMQTKHFVTFRTSMRGEITAVPRSKEKTTKKHTLLFGRRPAGARIVPPPPLSSPWWTWERRVTRFCRGVGIWGVSRQDSTWTSAVHDPPTLFRRHPRPSTAGINRR